MQVPPKRQFTVVRLLGRSRSEGRVRGSSLPTWCTRPGPAAGTRRHSGRSSASWTPCVTRRRGEGEEASYRNPELCLPLATIQHGNLTQLPGFREAMVVVGGETEGVSRAAHLFCHRRQGSKLFVLLRNGVNSLNVVSATSLVMFKVNINIFQCCCG